MTRARIVQKYEISPRTVYYVMCEKPCRLIAGIYLDRKKNVDHYYRISDKRAPILGACDIDEIEKKEGFRPYHKRIVEKLRAEIQRKAEEEEKYAKAKG
ncbi:MAG: hypothetical protein V1928_02040 [Parcubacteria group bacterium]